MTDKIQAPRIIPTDSRAHLGEIATRAGEIVARQLFNARGNHSEAHLRELELALVAATAAHVALAMLKKEGQP